MQTIFKLIMAIVLIHSTSINACEMAQPESLEELILISEDVVTCIIDDKIYVNTAKVEFNENGIEIKLNEMSTICLSHLCVDHFGVFINLKAISGYTWICDGCGYVWNGGVHQWFCPNKGCTKIRRADW